MPIKSFPTATSRVTSMSSKRTIYPEEISGLSQSGSVYQKINVKKQWKNPLLHSSDQTHLNSPPLAHLPSNKIDAHAFIKENFDIFNHSTEGFIVESLHA